MNEHEALLKLGMTGKDLGHASQVMGGYKAVQVCSATAWPCLATCSNAVVAMEGEHCECIWSNAAGQAFSKVGGCSNARHGI